MRLNEAGSSWTAKDYGIAVLLVGSGLFAWGLLMYVSFIRPGSGPSCSSRSIGGICEEI